MILSIFVRPEALPVINQEHSCLQCDAVQLVDRCDVSEERASSVYKGLRWRRHSSLETSVPVYQTTWCYKQKHRVKYFCFVFRQKEYCRQHLTTISNGSGMGNFNSFGERWKCTADHDDNSIQQKQSNVYQLLKYKRPTWCHNLFSFILLLLCPTCFGH